MAAETENFNHAEEAKVRKELLKKSRELKQKAAILKKQMEETAKAIDEIIHKDNRAPEK